MILIWDNGEHYSDHSLYFIETLDYDVDDCLKLLKAGNSSGFLMGKGHSIEWFDGGTINIDEHILYWYLDDRGVVFHIKPETLSKFFLKWKNFEERVLKEAKAQNDKNLIQNIIERYSNEFKPLEEYVNSLKVNGNE